MRLIFGISLLLYLLLPRIVTAQSEAGQVECPTQVTPLPPAHAVAVVLEESVHMEAPGTPFSTHQRDAQLLITALEERTATTVLLFRYGQATSPTPFSAALAAAARTLTAQAGTHRTLVVITAGLPPDTALLQDAPAHPLLVIDLGGGSQTAAWAARSGAAYVPFQALQARELPARFAALNNALQINAPHAEPTPPSIHTCGAPVQLTVEGSPADWTQWLPVGAGGMIGVLALTRLRRRRMSNAAPRTADTALYTMRHTSPPTSHTPPPDNEYRSTIRRRRFEWARRRVNPRPLMTARLGVPNADTPAGSTLHPGTRIGAYVILRKLGVGGQAAGYLALGPGMRRVVIKVAHSASAAALHDEHAWLQRPAARHPHLMQAAPYAGADTLGIMLGPGGRRTTWIALAYTPGRSLTTWRRLRLDQALHVALQTAAALDHLHRSVGVIHQDVTPANLIVRLRWNGTLHTTLIDLGAADEPALPRRRPCYGTGPYLAPERMHQPPPPPDPQSDIFALGVVLRALVAEQSIPASLSDLISAMTHPEVAERRAALPDMAAVIQRLEGIVCAHRG